MKKEDMSGVGQAQPRRDNNEQGRMNGEEMGGCKAFGVHCPYPRIAGAPLEMTMRGG